MKERMREREREMYQLYVMIEKIWKRCERKKERERERERERDMYVSVVCNENDRKSIKERMREGDIEDSFDFFYPERRI